MFKWFAGHAFCLSSIVSLVSYWVVIRVDLEQLLVISPQESSSSRASGDSSSSSSQAYYDYYIQNYYPLDVDDGGRDDIRIPRIHLSHCVYGILNTVHRTLYTVHAVPKPQEI